MVTRDPLEHTAHRPWPLPDRPWAYIQHWHDLLFAHWPVDPGALRPLVPPTLPLDTFDGLAWVGIVPFRITGLRPRGVPPIPGASAFPELNVRTYTTVGGKPGVYFFSLDAASTLAVLAARVLFRLPYYRASMEVRTEGDVIVYRSRRARGRLGGRAAFTARYRPTGPVRTAAPGSLDHFLAERYCLYTVGLGRRVLRVDIHHPPWPLRPAEADIAVNSMAGAAGISLPDRPPLLHFARHQDVVGWLPRLASR